MNYIQRNSRKLLMLRHCIRQLSLQSNKDVIMCPGQGSQYVGMLQNYEGNDATKRIVDSANDILGYDILKLCKEGPKEILDRTLYCQPAIVLATMIGFEVLKQKKQIETGLEFKAHTVVGYSLGEISALYTSHRINYRDALRIVKERAIAMEYASNLIPSGMISVQGLTFDEARQVCEDLTTSKDDPTKHSLSIAIELFPKCVSVGGSHVMMNRVMNREHSLLKDHHKVQLTKLDVSGAFHTSYMIPAQEQLHRVLEEINILQNDITIFSNVTGKPYSQNDNIKELLVRQIAEPVLMNSILQNINEQYQINESMRIYEVGTGRVIGTSLSRINRKLLKIIEYIPL